MLALGMWLKVGAIGFAIGIGTGWVVRGWKEYAGRLDDVTAAYSQLVARTGARARLAEKINVDNAAAGARLRAEISRLRRKNDAPLPPDYRPPELVAGVASCPNYRSAEWVRRYDEAARAGSLPAGADRVPADPP